MKIERKKRDNCQLSVDNQQLINDKGFTLIEIVVVIVVIVLITGIVVPRLGNMLKTNLKTATRIFAGTVYYLYNEALFKKKDLQFVIDVENDEYWVNELEGSPTIVASGLNQFVQAGGELGKRRSLPDGVHFKDVETPSQGKVDEGYAWAFISHLGFFEGIIVHLIDDHENEITLIVNPMTAEVTPKEGYVEVIR